MKELYATLIDSDTNTHSKKAKAETKTDMSHIHVDFHMKSINFMFACCFNEFSVNKLCVHPHTISCPLCVYIIMSLTTQLLEMKFIRKIFSKILKI